MLLFKYQYDAALFLITHRWNVLLEETLLQGWTEHMVLTHCIDAYKANDKINSDMYRALLDILRKHSMLPYSD